jgi:hypothetical protein
MGQQLWAGRGDAGADADDVRELLNYRQAIDLVSECLSSGAPIGEGLILARDPRSAASTRPISTTSL